MREGGEERGRERDDLCTLKREQETGGMIFISHCSTDLISMQTVKGKEGLIKGWKLEATTKIPQGSSEVHC